MDWQKFNGTNYSETRKDELQGLFKFQVGHHKKGTCVLCCWFKHCPQSACPQKLKKKKNGAKYKQKQCTSKNPFQLNALWGVTHWMGGHVTLLSLP